MGDCVRLRLPALSWLGHATTRAGGFLYFRKGCVLDESLAKSIKSSSNQALVHESVVMVSLLQTEPKPPNLFMLPT